MRIRLKRLMAGPDGVKPAGSVVELPDEQARGLVESGQAEAVETPPPAPPLVGEGIKEVEARETAVSAEAENREKRVIKARNRTGK